MSLNCIKFNFKMINFNPHFLPPRSSVSYAYPCYASVVNSSNDYDM